MIEWPLQIVDQKIIGVYSRAFVNYALCLIFVMILVFLSEQTSAFLKGIHSLIVSVLGWFGKYTLELYLIHVGLRRVMNQIGYPTYRLSHEAVLVVVSIILSVLVSKVAGPVQNVILKKMLPAK